MPRLFNVDRARENVERHAWAQKILAGWQEDVAYLMARDRDFIESMIPELTAWPEYGQNCPVCVDRLSSMGETGIYAWDVRDPDRLVCTYCQTAYPHPDHPETGSITAPRMGQTFTYYLTEEERAHPDDRSGKHAFKWVGWPVHTSWTGIIRSKKARYCFEKILPLAQLYALTGDIAYAEKAAAVIDCMARRYPHWLFHSYDGTVADCPPAEAAVSMGNHPRGGQFPVETIITPFAGRHQQDGHAVLNNGFWGAGRFGCSGSDGGSVLQITLAYDLIHDARYDDGTPVLTDAMRERIVNDLILAACDDTEQWNEINNKCGPGRALSAAVGLLFDRPASVRRAVAAFEALLDKAFHFDGICTESPSYATMHLNLMRQIPELLACATDMEGPDPFRHFERYRLAQEGMVRALDPNREIPVLGDSRAGTPIDPIYLEVLAAHYGDRYAGLLERALGAPLAEAGGEYALWHRDPDLTVRDRVDLPHRTEWFPGWHVAVLRAGDPAGHTALYLNGARFDVHRHYDTLGLVYIAHGKEMAADRGYIWDDPRNAWTKSTLAHNIVTVDGENQPGKKEAAALELFGTGAGVEIVQAAANQYDQCSTYRRTCVLVQIPDGQSYAVDFFRVRGGGLHQYGFHCNGTLSRIEGAAPAPIDESIEWLDNIRAATPSSPFTATWHNDPVQLDFTLLNPVDRVLLVDAPGWRSDSGEELHAPPVQQLLAERRGADVASRFVAVLSPHRGTAPIQSTRLLLDDPATDLVAVAIARDHGTDYIVSSPNGTPCDLDLFSTDGRFAFLSVDDSGRPLRAYLQGGTELRCGDLTLACPEAETRIAVSAVEDRTYHLADAPPESTKSGDYILVGDTGYEIAATDGRRVTVRDYPAIAADAITLVHTRTFP